MKFVRNSVGGPRAATEAANTSVRREAGVTGCNCARYASRYPGIDFAAGAKCASRRAMLCFCFNTLKRWCPEQDSNLHALQR